MDADTTPPAPRPEIAPYRRTWADDLMDGIDSVLPNHWLKILNLAVAVFVALPFAAPILAAAGYDATGERDLRIYSLYVPSASRAVLVHLRPPDGLLRTRHRDVPRDPGRRARSMARPAGDAIASRSRLYVLLSIPIAVDGFTQLLASARAMPCSARSRARSSAGDRCGSSTRSSSAAWTACATSPHGALRSRWTGAEPRRRGGPTQW